MCFERSIDEQASERYKHLNRKWKLHHTLFIKFDVLLNNKKNPCTI